MPATVGINGVGTFGPMLKEFYQGPVAEQINNRVWIREYFQKKSKGWSGKQMVMPIHVGRNSGVGFQGEMPGALPTAGQQQYRDLRINSHSSYGRFQVSGLAMDTATKAGVGAFAGVMSEEMDRLVRDIANNENSINIYGGQTKGFLNQRRASPNNSGAAQTSAGGEYATPAAWQYQGDFSYFDGTRSGLAVAAATPATWVPIELVDMNTYELIPITTIPGAATTNGNFFVTGFSNDRTNPTIDITFGKDDVAVATFTTANVLNERAIAVRIKASRSFASGGAADFIGQNPLTWTDGSAAPPLGDGGQNIIDNQPRGLFENLASQQHFGVDRFATGTTPATILQSTVITHDNTTAAAATFSPGDRREAGADLSLERLQYMMDTLQQDAGVDADVMVMNALMRHRYTVQLTGILGTGNSNNVVIDGDSGKIMDNQQNLAYGGVKFQYDRQFPICTIGMLHSSDWILAELTTGQFADEDGNVLFRVQGQDAYEGFWKHRYNICCKRPNAQLILTGITPT
jgi:hypothetical protein